MNHFSYIKLLELIDFLLNFIFFFRFDASGINKLPNYMKILYRALLNYEDQLEEELTQEGRSFGSHYEKEAV